MNIFDINLDIRVAETLSSRFYKDERFFEESKEKIFARTWQLVGLESEVDNLLPKGLLEDFVSEPILFTRGSSGALNCISNVCTHRGKVIVEDACEGEGLKCAYHGRRFSLDGEFLSMPEFDEAKNFPREKDNLRKIPFKKWHDFLFVSLNPLASFEKFIAEMQDTTSEFDFENIELVSKRDYFVKAHWALYCENYLEGFHIPFVHKSLNEVIDFGTYTTKLFRYSSLQTGYDDQEKPAAQYFFVFPNMMFNFYPWGLSVNIVKPIESSFTKIEYWTFVSDESKLDEGAGANLELVEREDQAVVESVQKGINSRFYERGRYSPNREQGTHHFHQLISEFMSVKE